MRGSKSFANEYGITQKNLTSNPSMGIGLNPNLNIEDEYIENLLKQVHFLNMEIKLVKEKQKQNKGLGIMGLLNKDQNPVVSHAITSNDKFTEMKNKLQKMVNEADAENLKLEDQNFAVKAQKDYLQKLNLKEEQKNIENKLYVEKQLGEGIEKLRDQQKKLQELRQEANKTSNTYQNLKQEWDDNSGKDRTKKLLKTINSNLEGQTTGLREKHFQKNKQNLETNSKRLSEADTLYREDPKYQQLVEENKQLKQRLKKSDKELFDINYRVKEMEQLKKLCFRNKDVESQLKKQATEETDRLKKRLTDRKTDFEGRLRQSKTNLDTNEEVRIAKGKIARKDKQISDIKRKVEVSENNYKKLRDEVMKLQEDFDLRKEKNKQKEQEVHKLTVMQNQTQAEFRKAQLDYQRAEADLKNAESILRDARKRLETLEEQCAYLEAKQQHLTKEVDMDEGIRQVKIQQLSNLMQSNNGLNTTITDLMEKWDQIIRFSRQPPA